MNYLLVDNYYPTIKTAPLDTSVQYLLEESKRKIHGDSELDEEWKILIRQAIEDGIKKEDFHEYRNYIKFQSWMKEQNKG